MHRDAHDLAGVLAGVRAFVLDADGVLVLRDQPLPGAFEALGRLAALGYPFRIVTNYSLAHRTTLAARFAAGGRSPVRADTIITAASAAAAHTARAYPGGRLLVLASADARREFDGQGLVRLDEADDPGARVDAVVIGDAGDDLTFRAMDVAFRRIAGGAGFVAMHRNLWWLTPRGMTLDAGALVTGLEAATGRRAVVAGKPSPVVFRQALVELRAELSRRPGAARLSTREVAMVGDDPAADVAAAKRVGLMGILVLSGKTGASDLEARGALGRRIARADAVAPDLAAVVAALPGA
jgi:HAD superfamily hydrolase (TIGR01450 family)